MFARLPDHPQIRWAERTGYPSWAQEEQIGYCERCGKPVYTFDTFADIMLCDDCGEEDEDV